MEKQQIDLSSLLPHTSIVSSNIFSYIYLLLHRANKQKFSLTPQKPQIIYMSLIIRNIMNEMFICTAKCDIMYVRALVSVSVSVGEELFLWFHNEKCDKTDLEL